MTNISTIQASGGDYATVTAWEAAVEGTLTDIEEGQMANEAFDEHPIIAGSTTTATKFMRLTYQSGAMHDGTPASGARIIPTSSGHNLEITDQYTEIIGIEFGPGSSRGSSDEGCRLNNGADDVLIDSCLFRDMTHTDGDGLYSTSSAAITGLVVQNCFFYSMHRAGIHFQNYSANVVAKIVNNTFHNCNLTDPHGCAILCWPFDSGISVTLTMYNNNIVANDNVDIKGPTGQGTITLNGSDNIIDHDDVTVGGSLTLNNNLTDSIDVPESNVSDNVSDFTSGNWVFFVNLTAGSFDLHIQDDANNAAKGNGIGPASESSVPTVDVDGDSRSGTTCDIGADELVLGRTTKNTDTHPLGQHTAMGWRVVGNP